MKRLISRLSQKLRRSKHGGAARKDRRGEWLSGIFQEPKPDAGVPSGPDTLQYCLYLPADRTFERIPLMVMLHGCSQTALEFADGTRMNAIAEDRHCAVLYPVQSKRENSLSCWNWFAPEVLAGKGEASLIAHTVQHILDEYPIDSARVYVTGLSAGGAMAAVLCSTHCDMFAACAIHSGIMFHAAATALQAVQVMHQGSRASMNQIVDKIIARRLPGARLVPTLIIHGTDDTIVNPRNSEQLLEQTKLLAESLCATAATLEADHWVEGNGRRYLRKDLTQGGTMLARIILVDGLGHAWSGGDARYKFFDATGPDASRLIVDFLMPYRLPRS